MLSVEPDILTDLPWGQLLVNGLALGSLYALTAFGIVLIFKTTRVITFAQGETAMFSTFVAFTLLTAFQLPFAVAFVLTMLFAAVFGALIERVIIRRISTTTVLNPVIVTVGLSLILLGAAGWIWGYEIRTFPDPVVGPPFHIGAVVVSQLNALIFLVTLVLMTVLFAFFRFSPTGIAMRAVAENRVAAQLMGISIGRMNGLGWGMGTAMGAVTGMLIAPINYLDPSMMGDVALKAFAGAVVGGLTSLPGAIPGVAPGYVLYLVSLALIYAVVAIGLGILIGYTGQISLGHAGFFAIGAYASALLTLRLGLPFVVAVLVAGSVSAAIGFLLGLPALRLSGPYLAVATLGFGLAIPQLVVWQGSWTGGSSGLHGLPLASLPLGAFTIVFRTDQDYYYLAAAVLIVLTIFARNVVTSHTGRAFVAIRDSEIAARAMGVNLVRYKTTAFALSALYAGIAGALYAHLLHGISPEDFTVLLSVDFLTMIVLGGLGSVGGALSGALLLTFLQNALTRLPVVHDFKNLYIVVL